MTFHWKTTNRHSWLERRVDLLSEAMGFDVVQLPALVAVVSEIQSGSDIKAAQLYTQAFSCDAGEAIAAVADLKQRVGR